jgi:tRNA A37 threonylcarbamoyladenosine modification protein TsaB
VTKDGWIAASYDAHRGQLYAGLYHRACGKCERRGEDQVVSPDDFLTYVREQSGGSVVQWASLDPSLLAGLPSWQEELSDLHPLWPCVPYLANSIGEIAEEKAASGESADVLELDANYVRRSDAEIFWKGPADRAR